MIDMDEKLRILLCEDDENLGMLLREYLQAKGYAAELYPDGEAGYKAFLKNKYDLCVFDVMMPKKDGFTLAQEVRAANAEIPVIFLTAKTLKEDILEGFKIGADDYITKPFNILEVKARIKAIMRRAGSDHEEKEKAKSIQVGDLRMDCEGRRVFIAGKEINLTAKEFDLLELLVMNPNKVYSRENLLNLVWGYEYPGDVRTVDVHIRRLREKIEMNPSEPKYVHTKWGVGYYFRG